MSNDFKGTGLSLTQQGGKGGENAASGIPTANAQGSPTAVPIPTPVSHPGPHFCFTALRWASRTSGPEIGGAQSYPLRPFCGRCLCIQIPSSWAPHLDSQPGPLWATFSASWAYSACHLSGRVGRTQQSKITPTIAHCAALYTSPHMPCLTGASVKFSGYSHCSFSELRKLRFVGVNGSV